MSTGYDVILVGGGHNNLTAAGYLAKAGKSVLVLEKNLQVGGGLWSQEVTAPGFIHELHASALFLIRANPLMANDELELMSKYDLEWCEIDGPYFTSAFDDGEYLATYPDVDRTCNSIARLSQKDAQSYRYWAGENGKLVKLLIKGMFAPPLTIGQLLKFVEGTPEGRNLTRLLMSSAYDFIDQNFENKYVRAHIYKWISENLVSPDEVGSGLIALILLGMGHAVRPGIVKGGNQNLAHALVRQIEAQGGEVHCNQLVTKFNVESGRIIGVTLENGETVSARECVVSGVPAWDLPKFIDGLDESKLGDIRGLKPSGYTVFLTHYALHEAPRFHLNDELNKSFVIECMSTNLESFRECYDRFKFGYMPELYSGHCVCPTHIDPTRAPEGKHGIYYYHYVPLIPKGMTLEDWPEIKEGFADWMLEGLRRYSTNMDESNIIARYVESPWEMHQHSPSFRNGECFGAAMTPRQFMAERPTPELGQYRVPGVEGLYLCGPAQHPGGGCIGGGRPVAMRILMDQEAELSSVFAAL